MKRQRESGTSENTHNKPAPVPHRSMPLAQSYLNRKLFSEAEMQAVGLGLSLGTVPLSPLLELMCTFVEGSPKRFRNRVEMTDETQRLLTFIISSHDKNIDLTLLRDLLEGKTSEVLDFLRIVEREPILFDSVYLRDPQLERVRLIYYYRHSEHMNRDNCLLFTINPSQFYSQMAFFVDHPVLFKSVEKERLKCFMKNRDKLLTAATTSPNTQRAATILNSLLPPNHNCDLEAYLNVDSAYGSHFLCDAELGYIQGKPDEDMFVQSRIIPSERKQHDSLNRAEVVRWLRQRWGGSISHVYLNFQALYHLHSTKISETSRRRLKIEDGVTTTYTEVFCALSVGKDTGESARSLPLSIGEVPGHIPVSLLQFPAAARGGGVRTTPATRPLPLSLRPRKANAKPQVNVADIVEAIEGHLDNVRGLLDKLVEKSTT